VAERNRETGTHQERPRRQGPGHGCVGVLCRKGRSQLGANSIEGAELGAQGDIEVAFRERGLYGGHRRLWDGR
jgi:hypothetical protein